MSSIGLVILAAGASARMGTPKQLLRYQGHSFLRHITEIALTSECGPIVIVLGAYADQIKLEVAPLPVHIVVNLQWTAGMGCSIRVGIETLINLFPHLEAAIVLLCDQPFVSMQLIHQLIEIYYFTQLPIVTSGYAGTFGVPALFHRRFFPDLLALGADQGAKHLIRKYAGEAAWVPFSKGAIDVDTPEDYQQLQASLRTEFHQLNSTPFS